MLEKECNCRCCNYKIWQFQSADTGCKMQPWNSAKEKAERGGPKGLYGWGAVLTTGCTKGDTFCLKIRL